MADALSAKARALVEAAGKATEAPWDCWDMDESGWHVFATKFNLPTGGQDCKLSIAAVRAGRSHATNSENYHEQVNNAEFIKAARNDAPDIAKAYLEAVALLKTAADWFEDDDNPAAADRLRAWLARHEAEQEKEG